MSDFAALNPRERRVSRRMRFTAYTARRSEKMIGGADARVQVNFRHAGSKWLALEYAKLTAV